MTNDFVEMRKIEDSKLIDKIKIDSKEKDKIEEWINKFVGVFNGRKKSNDK